MELLDLTVSTQRLTQGQPPADRAVAVQRAVTPTPPEATPRAPTSASASAPASPDPYVIAQRVYELMRQDLVAFRDRRGPRG